MYIFRFLIEANTKHCRGPHDTLMHTLSTTPREAANWPRNTLPQSAGRPPTHPEYRPTSAAGGSSSMIVGAPAKRELASVCRALQF